MDIPSYILGRIKGSGGAGVSYVVVEELPTTGEEGTIYLVPKSTSKTNNVYNEYMWISNEWELIGDTEADLTDYVKNTDYATSNTGGVIKTSWNYGTRVTEGLLNAQSITYNDYQSLNGRAIIGKDTLENVIIGKGLQTLVSIYQLAGLSEYSSSSTYTVGDYVYYNNLIYKCNTAVSVAEDFDSTKWTQKTYMEYMSDTLVGTALGGSY